MSDRRRFLSSTSAMAWLAVLSRPVRSAEINAPPAARRVQASDDYYGTTIEDPYR
jgi:hypothetical protein